MIGCPSCGRAQARGLLCLACGAPLPAAELDLFSALGLERRLALDLPALEAAYHDLGRRLHPDRFAAAPTAIRTASLSATAMLTRAYRMLRDPVTRGLYWLELNGEKLAENNKSVPMDIAEMVFDVQAELAEMRAASGDGALREAIVRRRAELGRVMADAQRELALNFSGWDADRAGARKAELVAQLKAILSKIAYLRTLIRDVDRDLEGVAA